MIVDRNTWATPQVVYDTMNRRYNFKMDICADDINHKHTNYLTEKDDALTYDIRGKVGEGVYVWCNPPYSKPKPWVELAIKNAGLGVGTVMLVKHDCSTSWYKLAVEYAHEIIEVIGDRLSFVPPDGVKASSNNFASCFIVFHPYLKGVHKRSYITKEELYHE